MDLTTNYLGLKLRNPLVTSASPLTHHLDNFKKMDDAGIGAIVCHSLFEEQILQEMQDLDQFTSQGTESFAESLTYYPEASSYVLAPDEYLTQIEKAKKVVNVPVIASLNGHTLGGWTKYARRMEDAGADALELNVYKVATDADQSGDEIEKEYLDVVDAVKSEIQIPIAVKMHPFFSSVSNMARKYDDLGVDGLVLFNRFYQPDIDLDELDVFPNVQLSTAHDIRLPLRWIAILYGQIDADLAATTGIHTAEDVLKLLMAGASTTMLCATIMKNGIKQISVILEEMQKWMEEHEYDSIQEMQGSLSQKFCPDPKAFERANYMKSLQSFKLQL